MGARATPAYQMLAVGAACAGLASHEAVRELTALLGGREHPGAEIETDSRLRDGGADNRRLGRRRDKTAMMKLLLGSLPAQFMWPVSPLNRQQVHYMNLLTVSSTKSPASPISTSFHFSLPANSFRQAPRILTQAETTSMGYLQL